MDTIIGSCIQQMFDIENIAIIFISEGNLSSFYRIWEIKFSLLNFIQISWMDLSISYP